jgi:hypothetical protein
VGMATEGNPYFVLDDMEEKQMWSEFWTMSQVRESLLSARDPFLRVV